MAEPMPSSVSVFATSSSMFPSPACTHVPSPGNPLVKGKAPATAAQVDASAILMGVAANYTGSSHPALVRPELPDAFRSFSPDFEGAPSPTSSSSSFDDDFDFDEDTPYLNSSSRFSDSASALTSEDACSCKYRHLELRTPTFALPLYLPRPSNVRTLDLGHLELDEELSDVPVRYILDKLRLEGPSLLQTITYSAVVLPADVAATGCLPPTLAVRGPSSPAAPDCIIAVTAENSMRKLLLPAHGLVLSVHCKAFSQLSRCLNDTLFDFDTEQQGQLGTRELPVVHIRLPSAKAFSMLVPYFYAQSSSGLLSSLLPLHHEMMVSQLNSGASDIDVLLSDTPNILASRLSLVDQKVLLAHTALVHSVWKCAVALGAARDGLWKTMEVAWSVLVGALAMSESRKVRKEEDS